MNATTEDRVQKTQFRDYLPILEWLPKYDRGWLRGDVLAAATVWALVVPQAIAYAQIAGLPPQAGLFATFAALIGYALFGTSRQVIVSPTSSTAAISAAIVGTIALGDSTRYADLSSALALLVGLAFIVFGIGKVGFISRFIAPAVQIGFMFGLGLTIIIGQVPNLLGLPGGEGDFFPKLWQVITNLSHINPWTAVIGLGSLAALFAMKKFAPRLPAALLMVLVSIIVVTAFGLAQEGVDVIGVVNGAIPLPSLPRVSFDELVILLPGALAISVIGFAETITVADDFAEKHKYEIRPNQELVAVGAANIFSGFFQGFIVGGGASQSAANDAAGARSQIVSVVVSVLTVLTLLFLLPLFANLPQAVLSAIVIVAVTGFLNVKALQRIAHLRRDSFYLALFALVSVLLLGILPGLLIAVTLSILLILGFFARPPTSVLGNLPGTDAYVPIASEPTAQLIPGLMIFRLDAPLLSLNAKRMRDHLRQELHAAKTSTRVVILDLSFNSELDIQGLDILNALYDELRAQSIELWLANVYQAPRAMLERGGVVEKIGAANIFLTVRAAVQAFQNQNMDSNN
ncbi:MAG: sulfate permease [Chloroflexota bacterium]|nr:MAG: sulfate permease [Chloroflexota bacterium]